MKLTDDQLKNIADTVIPQGTGVSVILVNSQRNSKWFNEAVFSLRNQKTAVDIELVEIENHDGRSTISECYNKGLQRCKYNYVLILNDDDVLNPNAIDIFVRTMIWARQSDPSIYRVCCESLLIDEDSHPICRAKTQSPGLFIKEVLDTFGGFPDIPWWHYSTVLLVNPEQSFELLVEGKYKSLCIDMNIYYMRVHQLQASIVSNQKVFFEACFASDEQKDVILREGVGEATNLSKLRARMSRLAMSNIDECIPTPKSTTLCMIRDGKEEYLPTSTFGRCLDNIAKTTNPISTLVVSRNHAARTGRALNNRGIKFTKDDRTYGEIYNDVFTEINTPFLAIINPVIYVPPWWLETLIGCFVRNEDRNPGLVSCTVETDEGYLWSDAISIDSLLIPELISMPMAERFGDTAPHETETQGSRMHLVMLNRMAYKHVKFDGKFKTSLVQEIDFNMQIRNHGMSCWWTPYITALAGSNNSRIGELASVKEDVQLLHNKWKGSELLMPTNLFFTRKLKLEAIK